MSNVNIEISRSRTGPTRRRRGQGRITAAGAVLAVALLGACGGGSSDSAGDRAGSVTTSATTVPSTDQTESTSPSTPADTRGDVAIIATDGTEETVETDETRVESDSTQAPVPVPTVGPPPPTTVPLPRPIAPPADDGSRDPEVQLGRLAIPAIGIDNPMFEGIRLPTFDLGPGHWPGSAMPGQIGNMIIGGHRTEGHADFRNLDQLQPGDQVIVTTNDGTAHTYAVQSTEIVDPLAARVLNQTPERTATLFACHPPGSVKQRIVVHLALTA